MFKRVDISQYISMMDMNYDSDIDIDIDMVEYDVSVSEVLMHYSRMNKMAAV